MLGSDTVQYIYLPVSVHVIIVNSQVLLALHVVIITLTYFIQLEYHTMCFEFQKHF